VVIIDEASQTNLPSALVPLLRTKAEGKAILVGDHKQLPPFGLSEEDLKQLPFSKEVDREEIINRIQEIFHVSIFEELINSVQFNRIMLSTNYRWHWAIGKLLSELFYEDRLAADRQEEILLPDTFKVIDTSKHPDKTEERVNSSFKNQKEAAFAVAEIKRLLKEDIPPEEIGVISFYKAQVEQIQGLLNKALSPEISSQIRVATVDSFQGREKKVIILSATRSNDRVEVGFLNDLRRLNVALSRARDRLIIIGDFSTLTNPAKSNQVADIFSRVFSYAEELRVDGNGEEDLKSSVSSPLEQERENAPKPDSKSALESGLSSLVETRAAAPSLAQQTQAQTEIGRQVFASSAVAQETKAPGGIDFRFLPIVTQSMSNLRTSIRTMPQSSLQRINLTQEWSDIEHLVKAGITPSGERIREYVQVSCLRGNSDMQKVVSCIADILRLEEERSYPTEAMLKDILVVLESGRSVQELKAVFVGANS